MLAYPHRYRAFARGGVAGAVETGAPGLEPIATWPPPEFDGPSGEWSPEALLVAAIADCYVLSFRAVARVSRFEWDTLDVQVEGVLDRVDGVTRFTRFRIAPALVLAAGSDEGRAQAVLEKAKRACLVTNSLSATCELVPSVTPAAAAA